MVSWMDSIDASLAKMFKGISSDKDFEVSTAIVALGFVIFNTPVTRALH